MRIADIPGYLDAVDRERFARDVAILGLTEKIGEFELVPMTLWHYLILKTIESPFIPPFGEPTEKDLVQFLWLLNPKFVKCQKRFRKFSKRCKSFLLPKEPIIPTERACINFLKRMELHRGEFNLLTEKVKEFVSEIFQDRPPRVDNAIPEPSYYSDIITIIGAISREWKCEVEAVLDMPMQMIFQVLNEIRDVRHAMAEQVPVMFNPSDKIKSDWMRQHAERRN